MLVLTRRPSREPLDVCSEIILTRGREVIRLRLVESSSSKARIGVEAEASWSIRRGDSPPQVLLPRKARHHDA